MLWKNSKRFNTNFSLALSTITFANFLKNDIYFSAIIIQGVQLLCANKWYTATPQIHYVKILGFNQTFLYSRLDNNHDPGCQNLI